MGEIYLTAKEPLILGGTAYDFFISLYIIHSPKQFYLRPSWAAGVRSRLPEKSRNFLKNIMPAFFIPLQWLMARENLKNSSSLLERLEDISVEELMSEVVLADPLKPRYGKEFRQLLLKERVAEEDIKLFFNAYKKEMKLEITRPQLISFLNEACRPEHFQKMLLESLRNYYSLFFQEEENRIRKPLQSAFESISNEAIQPRQGLLQKISGGVLIPELLKAERLYLIPSFWISPRFFYILPEKDQGIAVFSAKPEDMSLIPGDSVPDEINFGLNALSDTTRLRILRLLSSKEKTQSELAKDLRLRPPTLSHHLRLLMTARLIVPKTGTKVYRLHQENLDKLMERVQSFIRTDKT